MAYRSSASTKARSGTRLAARPAIYFHLHLVSDATGETLNAVAKAACAQFDTAEAIEHIYALVRSRKQMQRVLSDIEDAPGIVIHTIVNDELRQMLEDHCRELQMPSVPVLDTVLGALGNYLGTETTHKPGGQHALDAEYFDRIEALNYTMAHDDGQSTGDLNDADIVLVGVSRTSKTPTSIYLANRGYKTANVPIVVGVDPPRELDQTTRPLVVGLTTTPDRLVHVRRNRLRSLKQDDVTDYTDIEHIKSEVAHARKIYTRHDWPVIDVTRRSIEETAAAVLNLYQRRNQVVTE